MTTQHPLVDMLIDHYLQSAPGVFITSGVMENPAPVSVNHLYATYRGNKVLTKEGRAYRDGLSAVIARSSNEWKIAVDDVYQKGRGAVLVIGLYFETLANASWQPGNRTKSGKLQEPRKTQDSANYIKIIEDAVKSGCGIDDCNNMVHLVYKAEDKLRPRTEVIYIVA